MSKGLGKIKKIYDRYMYVLYLSRSLKSRILIKLLIIIIYDIIINAFMKNAIGQLADMMTVHANSRFVT